MKTYMGTKAILARPMNRQEYNDYRGWELPADENGANENGANENGADEGFLVEYINGGGSNHPDHDGYISWSPRDVFHEAYQPTEEGMDFGHALECIKRGGRVARVGWNGKGMFLFLVPGSTFKVNRPPLMGIYPEGTEINYHAHIDMRTADGQIVPWLCSQTDMLAEDWVLVG